jgi:CRP-like cAMP-binding protein
MLSFNLTSWSGSDANGYSGEPVVPPVKVGPHAASSPLDSLVDRLVADQVISLAEVGLVRGLAPRRARVQAGDELVGPDCGEAARFLVSGWAAETSLLADGRRQIHRLFVAGDVLGAPARVASAGGSIVALTEASTIEARELGEVLGDKGASRLAAALADAERQHLRLLNSAILRLGRMTAYERVAHLLLELAARLAAVGVGDGRRFPLPLTQEVLSDTLGLSVVHTNRVLQQLRRERLIELRSGVAVLLQPQTLASIVEGEAKLLSLSAIERSPPPGVAILPARRPAAVAEDPAPATLGSRPLRA